MAKHRFVGFGFGPIQSGLFVKEAFESGNFERIVVAEIDQNLVDAVRANKGSYYINVAKFDGIETVKVDNIELFNPNVEADRKELLKALAESTEIVTSLPSVKFFDSGANSVACFIAEGIKNDKTGAKIIYTAENNNHAAEILEEAVAKKVGGIDTDRVQFLNTVIGKMSQVVTEAGEIEAMKIEPIATGIGRAFLVEEFNKILVTRTKLAGFRPGIEVFMEKDDLLPFEEAKLYGHNAIHMLLGYIGAARGYKKMSDLRGDKEIMGIGREAFLNESGRALVKKYANLGDELFTDDGYREYAEDLLLRMTNPWLTDTVERIARDPIRKLGYNDRIFGTMHVAIEYGIKPVNMAMGAIAGLAFLLARADENKLPAELRFGDWRKLSGEQIEKLIRWIWKDSAGKHAAEIIRYVQEAQPRLTIL